MRNSLIKSIMVTSALIGGVAFASVAQAGDIKQVFEGEAVVFEKSFDGKGKVQNIRFEKLDLDGGSSDGPGMAFVLKMKFKDSKKLFEATGSCFAEAGVMDCRIGCDDSGFSMKLEDDKSVSLINTKGFQLNGCSANKDAEVRTFEVDSKDPVYTLKSAKKN